MSIGIITLLITVGLLALILSGIPVVFSLLFIAIIGILIFVSPAALHTLPTIAFVTLTKDYYLAVSLFIFMAAILQFSGIGTGLYDMFHKWMGGLKGGLAMGTVGVSTLLAATTGSASTATVGMGLIAYPEMRKRGYDKMMSIGSILIGGVLGPLIPPSIPMIILASLAMISIGKLFISGIIPGLLTALIALLYIWIRCTVNKEAGPALPREERANWREKFLSLREVILPIALIFLVLGFIYMGICTPSEAGGIGALGALACSAIKRNLNWNSLKNALLTTLRINAMIFWVVIGGGAFSSMLGIIGVNQFIIETLTGLAENRWLVFTIMMLIVFIMGMFIDPTPITIICIPIFMPIVATLGFDPLWFGLIFTMDLLIGFVTPPFGVALFYFKGVGHPDVTMMDIYKASLVVVLILTFAWIICIIYPPVAMWLPSKMVK